MMKILVICSVLLCATASSALKIPMLKIPMPKIPKWIPSLRQQTSQLWDPRVTLVQQYKISPHMLASMDEAVKSDYIPRHIKPLTKDMITRFTRFTPQVRNESHELRGVAYGGAAASPMSLMLILPLALMLLWRNL